MLACFLMTRFVSPNSPIKSAKLIYYRCRSRSHNELPQKVELLIKQRENVIPNTITNRMFELVSGKKKVFPQTRSQRLMAFIILICTGVPYWYWLTLLERYMKESLLEEELMEYNKKGKLVDSKVLENAFKMSPVMAGATALKVKENLKKLEGEVKAFKAEMELMKEILEKNSK